MPLNNFGQVAPNLYRSAKPDAKAYQDLSTLGINHVFNLTENFNVIEGFYFFNVPIEARNPNLSLCWAIVQTLRTVVEKHPVLVHCEYGRDRTGLIIGMYRILYCNWTIPMVTEERALYGCRGIYKFLDSNINKILIKTKESMNEI